MMDKQDVVINSLQGITITVIVSPALTVRLWVARRLIQLATFVLGANYTERLEVA